MRVKIGQGHMILVNLIIWIWFFVVFRNNLETIVSGTFIRQVAVLGLFSLALYVELVIGDLDFSITAQVALSTVIFSGALQAGMPVILVMLFSFLFHIMIGCLKAILIVKIRIPPVILNLGLQVLLSNLWSETDVVLLPKTFYFIFSRHSIWIAVLLVAVVAGTSFLMKRTYFGKYCLMIGENEELVKKSGVNDLRVWIMNHILASVFLFLDMLFILSTSGRGSTGLSILYLYQAIAVCCISGLWLGSGNPRAEYIVPGTISIIFLNHLLLHYGIYNKYYLIILGVIILVQIALPLNSRKVSG